jgi:hypothetical protein
MGKVNALREDMQQELCDQYIEGTMELGDFSAAMMKIGFDQSSINSMLDALHGQQLTALLTGDVEENQDGPS